MAQSSNTEQHNASTSQAGPDNSEQQSSPTYFGLELPGQDPRRHVRAADLMALEGRDQGQVWACENDNKGEHKPVTEPLSPVSKTSELPNSLHITDKRTTGLIDQAKYQLADSPPTTPQV